MLFSQPLRPALEAAAGRGGATVSIQAIAKRYGAATPALDGVSLQIAAGEFVTLLGASASGKTTTLMIVAGFTTPNDGDVGIDDKSIIGLPPERRGIGVVFQNYALFPRSCAISLVCDQERFSLERLVAGSLFKSYRMPVPAP
jgi:ABC-type Fe3+/spermidine/putrescine transport system ATPase subunit